MHGILLTYQTLATDPDPAATEVLSIALDSLEPETVTRAVSALVRRSEENARRAILRHWTKLSQQDITIIRNTAGWLDATVLRYLNQPDTGQPDTGQPDTGQPGDPDADVVAAITAAKDLELFQAVLPMITLAESAGTRRTRELATQCVMTVGHQMCVVPRGDFARTSIRNRVEARLARSVRTLPRHGNNSLLRLFLLMTTAGSGEMRKIIADEAAAFEAVLHQLATSNQQGVIDLLASFVRAHQPPPRVIQILRTRRDDAFLDALLRAIGPHPAAETLRNLKQIFPSESWHADDLPLKVVQPSRHAAMIHLALVAHESFLSRVQRSVTDVMVDSRTASMLRMLVSAIHGNHPAAVAVAASGLSAIQPPRLQFWSECVGAIADDDQNRIAADRNTRLLKDLIDLIGHSDRAVANGARSVLAPLHADVMLEKIAGLSPFDRRQFGRVVLMVDPHAVNRVRDALRHPVLKHRMRAIAMADALAVVDLLLDSFTQITRDDHQQARIDAARAMGRAASKETVMLLEHMMQLPESSVRDAAETALQKRHARNRLSLADGC